MKENGNLMVIIAKRTIKSFDYRENIKSMHRFVRNVTTTTKSKNTLTREDEIARRASVGLNNKYGKDQKRKLVASHFRSTPASVDGISHHDQKNMHRGSTEELAYAAKDRNAAFSAANGSHRLRGRGVSGRRFVDVISVGLFTLLKVEYSISLSSF